jgi:ribosomal protein S18 acetylase RimI-like enzyme
VDERSLPRIEILTLAHVEAFLDHLGRHVRELGSGGIIVHPHPVDEPWQKRDLVRAELEKNWALPPGRGSWELAWGAIDGNKIVGSLELVGNASPSRKHRASLELGIEQEYRRRGLGKRLMQEALAWSQQQSFLQWMDAHVYAHNIPAIELYRYFGFAEVGFVKDALRVKDQKIDSLQMTLELTGYAPRSSFT